MKLRKSSFTLWVKALCLWLNINHSELLNSNHVSCSWDIAYGNEIIINEGQMDQIWEIEMAWRDSYIKTQNQRKLKLYFSSKSQCAIWFASLKTTPIRKWQTCDILQQGQMCKWEKNQWSKYHFSEIQEPEQSKKHHSCCTGFQWRG